MDSNLSDNYLTQNDHHGSCNNYANLIISNGMGFASQYTKLINNRRNK